MGNEIRKYTRKLIQEKYDIKRTEMSKTRKNMKGYVIDLLGVKKSSHAVLPNVLL